MEDNDPTGFKSKKGEAAKAECNIVPFVIPPRSPDLSVCDYALWTQINRSMRRQEKRFKSDKYEKRSDYVARLRRTAKNLSPVFVKKAIGNMKERCRRLFKSKGKHFEEGGSCA